MPIRSYNDATENDAPGWITITSNTRIDWSMFLDLLAILYWDDGAGFYDNTKDIHVQNDVIATSAGNTTLNTLFMVSTVIGGINDSLVAGHSIMAYLNRSAGGVQFFVVRERLGGADLNLTFPIMAFQGLQLYYDYVLDWTAATFTVNIYTDFNRTVTHRAAVVISISDTTAMQYMYAQASFNTSGAGSGVSGNDKNFNQITPSLGGGGISTNPLKSAIFGERGVLAA